MSSIDEIHKAFCTLLEQRGVHKLLNKTSNDIRQLRYRLRNNLYISTDLKLQLLQKSGWQQDQDCIYSRAQLVKAVAFALRQSARAKEMGAEYLVEKFLNSKK